MVPKCMISPIAFSSDPTQIPAKLSEVCRMTHMEWLNKSYSTPLTNVKVPFIIPIHPRMAGMFFNQHRKEAVKIQSLLDCAFHVMQEIYTRDIRKSRDITAWCTAFIPLRQYFAHKLRYKNTDETLHIDKLLFKPCKDVRQLNESMKRIKTTFTKPKL